jgi:hypothetical protein
LNACVRYMNEVLSMRRIDFFSLPATTTQKPDSKTIVQSIYPTPPLNLYLLLYMHLN